MPIDLGGNQTGIHKFAYQALLSIWALRMNWSLWTPCRDLPGLARRCLKRFHVDTRYIAAKAPESFKGDIVQNRRNGRLWHDLKDEFGVVWSMPDDHPLYMDISYNPSGPARLSKDIADYPFPKGQRSEPVRRAAAAGKVASKGNTLCRGQRDLGRGLRNLLVYARAGSVVYGHAHRSRSFARHFWIRR